MELMQKEEEEMEVISTSQRPSQEEGVGPKTKRIDVISLSVAFVKEIHDKGLTSEEIKGVLKLVEKLLNKENLL